MQTGKRTESDKQHEIILLSDDTVKRDTVISGLTRVFGFPVLQAEQIYLLSRLKSETNVYSSEDVSDITKKFEALKKLHLPAYLELC